MPPEEGNSTPLGLLPRIVRSDSTKAGGLTTGVATQSSPSTNTVLPYEGVTKGMMIPPKQPTDDKVPPNRCEVGPGAPSRSDPTVATDQVDMSTSRVENPVALDSCATQSLDASTGAPTSGSSFKLGPCADSESSTLRSPREKRSSPHDAVSVTSLACILAPADEEAGQTDGVSAGGSLSSASSCGQPAQQAMWETPADHCEPRSTAEA